MRTSKEQWKWAEKNWLIGAFCFEYLHFKGHFDSEAFIYIGFLLLLLLFSNREEVYRNHLNKINVAANVHTKTGRIFLQRDEQQQQPNYMFTLTILNILIVIRFNSINGRFKPLLMSTCWNSIEYYVIFTYVEFVVPFFPCWFLSFISFKVKNFLWNVPFRRLTFIFLIVRLHFELKLFNSNLQLNEVVKNTTKDFLNEKD